MDNHSNLVKIYLLVCDEYEKNLKFAVQRFSNNNKPEFTDQEVMTIMLFCTSVERRFKVKEVYCFAANYLRGWFPLLPSYVAFTMRVNRLGEAFRLLLSSLLENEAPENRSESTYLVDSMPIIICSGKRRSKVANEIADKSYCASKSIYYYGVKVHLLTSKVDETLPFPERIIITPASEADLNVFRDNWSQIAGKNVFADKAYQDTEMESKMLEIKSEILSPVKYPRGVPEQVKQLFRAADDLFSTAVSSIRQPIESLFNWFIEKSDIQRASKVRSTNGLIVHIFNKLAAIYIQKLIINP